MMPLPRLPVLSRLPARRSLTAACVLAAGVVVMAAQARGQEGGVFYSFGIDQRLQSQTNPGLDIPAAASETTARTRLSFGAVSETRTQRLAFGAEASLVAGNARDTGLLSPAADLSYRRDGAGSALTFSAFIRETEVDALDFFTGIDAGGNPVLTLAEGSGTQRRSGATLGLEFGRDAPFGGSLSLASTQTDYTGTSDPDLVSNRRDTARLALRFALNPVTDATAAWSTTRLDEEGFAAERSDSLSLGLARAVKRGALTLDATLSRVPEGTRRSLSFGRSIDLPAGALSASLGVTSVAAGGTSAIGALDWRHDLPRGAVTLGLRRAVTGNARDEETEITGLSLDLAQELTPRLGLTASIGLQDSRETASDISTTSANLSAALRYALTEDWGMNLGATHRILDETGVGTARSSSLFVSLSRSFEVRR